MLKLQITNLLKCICLTQLNEWKITHIHPKGFGVLLRSMQTQCFLFIFMEYLTLAKRENWLSTESRKLFNHQPEEASTTLQTAPLPTRKRLYLRPINKSVTDQIHTGQNITWYVGLHYGQIVLRAVWSMFVKTKCNDSRVKVLIVTQ